MATALLQSINLYQTDTHGWRGVFRPATFGWALLAIVAGVALLSAYAWLHEQRFETDVAMVIKADQGRVQELNRSSEALRSSGKLDELQARVAKLEERNDRLQLVLRRLGDASLGSAHGYSTMVAEVANAGISGVWITRMDFAGVSGRLSLRGEALRPELLPEYLRSLSAQSALRGRGVDNFVLESTTDVAGAGAGRGAVSFTIAQQAEATQSLVAAVKP
jgi:hypothetical protein